MASRNFLLRATRNLYFRQHPTGQHSDDETLTKITEWVFQVLPLAEDSNMDDDLSELSLVETVARNSFLAICDEVNERTRPKEGEVIE